jgi:hypothetical protein
MAITAEFRSLLICLATFRLAFTVAFTPSGGATSGSYAYNGKTISNHKNSKSSNTPYVFPKVEHFKPPDGYQPVKGYEFPAVNIFSYSNHPSSVQRASASSKQSLNLVAQNQASSKLQNAPSLQNTAWYNYYQNQQSLPSSQNSFQYSTNNNNNNKNNLPASQYQANTNAPQTPFINPFLAYSNNNNNYPQLLTNYYYNYPSAQTQQPVYVNQFNNNNNHHVAQNSMYNNNNNKINNNIGWQQIQVNKPPAPTSTLSTSTRFMLPILPTFKPSVDNIAPIEPSWRRTPPPNICNLIGLFWKSGRGVK